MDLGAFSHMLLRRAWLPLLLAALGAAALLLVARGQQPLYEGLTRIRLDLARPSDYAQTQASKEILASRVEDLRTHDMAEAATERLGAEWLAAHGMDRGSLHQLLDKGWIGASSDINIYELQVKARHPDPAVAEAISLRWAETFVDRREKANLQLQLDERVVAIIRDDTSHQQVAPRRKLLAAAGLLAGLLLGTLLMLVLEYLDQSVYRDSATLGRELGSAVLGEIPPRSGDSPGPGAVRQALANGRSTAIRLVAMMLPALLLAALGAAAAFAFSKAQTPLHRARARIAMEPADGSNWGNAMAVRETMRGFKEDIKTFRMAREVSERLQLDMREADLLDPRRLNVAEDTGLFEIRVDVFHPQPEMAQAIARTWAQVFIEQHQRADLVRDQRDRTLMRLRDSVITVSLWSPKTGVNILAGGVLGMIVGAGALWLRLGLRSRRLRSPQEAVTALDAPVLGLIPPH